MIVRISFDHTPNFKKKKLVDPMTNKSGQQCMEQVTSKDRGGPEGMGVAQGIVVL